MSKSWFESEVFSACPSRSAKMTEWIVGLIPTHQPLTVLDIGCGTGTQILALASLLPQARLTGLDVSQRNIQIAEAARRCSPSRDRIQFVVADYLHWKGGEFDLIVSESTLHLIAIPTEELFRKVAGDLAEGGLLVITMPYDCFYNRCLNLIRRLLRAVRCPLTDGLILRIGKLLHGKEISQETLQERLPYTYLPAYRFSGPCLYRRLNQSVALELVHEQPISHASIAQLKHRISVFRKAQRQVPVAMVKDGGSAKWLGRTPEGK